MFELPTVYREQHDENQHEEKYQRRERIHFGVNADFQFSVNRRGERVDARAFGEVRDYKIVRRHRERQQKAREDTRTQFRQDDIFKRFERGRAQIQCRFVKTFVECH